MIVGYTVCKTILHYTEFTVPTPLPYNNARDPVRKKALDANPRRKFLSFKMQQANIFFGDSPQPYPINSGLLEMREPHIFLGEVFIESVTGEAVLITEGY